MSLTLPAASNTYDRTNEQQTRAQLEREDNRNLKRDEDLRLAQGAKLYVRGPDGTYREVTISNTGVISGGATVAQERSALGVNVADNRIINGRMEIDQRNNGSAVTVNASATFRSVDQYVGFGEAADGVFTLQRQSGGPPGFTNFLRAAVTTADSAIGAAQRYVFGCRIEGVNVPDLAWGTANAQSITRRFWARSSRAVTFSSALLNSAANRAYPFTFTINAANTWELKTVTIPGDTSGTWLTDTGIGLQMFFDLGSGSTFRGTANTWSGSLLFGVTGSASLIDTLGATLDITGEELVRTSADLGPSWRSFDDELRRARRYLRPISTAVLGVATAGGQNCGAVFDFGDLMRVAPTMAANGTANTNAGATTTDTVTASSFRFLAASTAAGAYQVNYTGLASAEF